MTPFAVMLLSVPFLVVTFFIYALIRELRTLYGQCIMAYVFSLTLMNSLLSGLNMNNRNILEYNKAICRCIGYTTMASVFMCFFWLNVMCYDTWSNIRSVDTFV
jgi:G protein-coupled receptor Mth (Methuselah protein)